jgi:hypothetical protein
MLRVRGHTLLVGTVAARLAHYQAGRERHRQ